MSGLNIIRRCSWELVRTNPHSPQTRPHPNYIVATYLPNCEDGMSPPSALGDKISQCRLTDSNRWPSDYKSDALPTELNWLTKFVVKHLENLSNDSNHLKNPPLGQPISSGSERLGFMWFLFRDSHPKTSYQSLQQSSIEHTQSTLLLPMSLVVDLEFLFGLWRNLNLNYA